MKYIPALLVLLLLATASANAATSIYSDDVMARLHTFVNTIYNATKGCADSLLIDTVNRPYSDDQALEMARHGLLYADEKTLKTVRDG